MADKKRYAIGVVFAAMVMVAARPAEALTLVSPAGGCPQTLGAAGEYLLTGDLACSGPVSGIIITASNVTLHLGGHTISSDTCNPAVDFAGVFLTGFPTNVQIDGGTIVGFNDGVVLYGLSSTLRGMKVRNSCVFGVAVAGTGNRLDKNLVTGSQVDGIGLGQAFNTLVTFNDISGNRRVGVDISNFSNNNIVYSNIINDNGVTEGWGIAVFNGLANILFDNVLDNNRNGIGLLSPGNLAQSNRVSGSVDTGIVISQIGAPSAVVSNQSFGNALDMSDFAAGCGANIWQANNFVTDMVAGVPNGGPSAGCLR